MNNLTLHSHVLIASFNNQVDLFTFISKNKFEHYSVALEDEKWVLAHPLTMEEREEYAWLYHKMKAQEKKDEPEDDDGPGDDPGPRYA